MKYLGLSSMWWNIWLFSKLAWALVHSYLNNDKKEWKCPNECPPMMATACLAEDWKFSLKNWKVVGPFPLILGCISCWRENKDDHLLDPGINLCYPCEIWLAQTTWSYNTWRIVWNFNSLLRYEIHVKIDPWMEKEFGCCYCSSKLARSNIFVVHAKNY